MTKTENILSWILKIGLFTVPFLPLVITRSLFFPFVTGKNFAFRILIEILVVVWVWLMLTNKKWRPKKSALIWSVTALIAVMVLSTIFSIWPYKSFWSNFERMEGLWSFLHYFVFFLMLGSVFQKRDWNRFWATSLGVSLLVSFYGVIQLLGKAEIHQGGVRLDGTLGNATYLAIYLVIHVFLFGYFFFKTNNQRLRLFIAIATLFELFIIYHTATRGAILGLVAGAFVFSLISAIWSSGKARKIALIILILTILAPSIFMAVKNISFIQDNPVLVRFANISLEETTTQSRFVIWDMAINAWKDKPVLGWGPESFVYIFSKEYRSELWKQEPWFDRAHNVFLDWLTSVGVAGLIAYLSTIVIATVFLCKLFRNGKIKSTTLGVFAGLFTAYMVNNLFAFDSFNTYFLFFAILAFVHWQHTSNRIEEVSNNQSTPNNFVRSIVTTIVLFAISFSVYNYNIKPIKAAKSVIETLRTVTYSQTGARIRDLDKGIEIIKNNIDLNTFGTTELREQAAKYADNINKDPVTSAGDKEKFITFALEEIQKQIAENPLDVRAKVFEIDLLSSIGDHQQAILKAKRLTEISPKRQQFYFILSEAYFKSGNGTEAINVAKKAYEIDPQNPDAVHNLAILYIYAGRKDLSDQLLKKHFDKVIFSDIRYINAYSAHKDFERMALIWESVVESNPANFEYRLGLVSIYLKTYQDQKAVEQLQKAIELNPDFSQQGQIFIQQILNGTIRSQ